MALLCLHACAAEQSPDERVEFIFEEDGYELCLGTAEHLDGYVERAFALLGAAPGSFVVPVHVGVGDACDGEANSCYHPADGRVTVLLDEERRPMSVVRHEVAHAVVFSAWGASVPFFHEGLATALSRDDPVFNEWTPEPRPVLDLLDRPAEQVHYESAGLFTRYLLDRVGIAAFRRIYTQARDGTREQVVQAIEDGAGEDFAAIEADFLSGAPRCTFQLDLCGLDDAEVVPAGASWSTSFAASCLAPGFYGYQTSETEFAATQFHIDLQGVGRYRVRLRGDAEFDPLVELTRCGDCGELSVRRLWNLMELDLDAGQYTVEFTVKPSAHYIDFELEHLGPA